MTNGQQASDVAGRLEDLIELAKTGKTIELRTRLYKKWVRHVSQSSATDDLDIETENCLYMADFLFVGAESGMPEKITKAYMICPINEVEIQGKVTRRIANKRLRMDYDRLKEAGISFEENLF